MTFIKTPGEDPTQAVIEAIVGESGAVSIHAEGQTSGRVEEAVKGAKTVTDGGAKSLGDLAMGGVGAKVEGALGHHVTGIAGGSIGGVAGGIADGGIEGAARGIAGGIAENSIPGIGGKIASSIVSGAVGGAAGAIASAVVPQALGGLVGGVAGGVVGGIAGGIAGGSIGGIAGKVSEPELPIFEEKAITSFVGNKATGSVFAKAGGMASGAAGAIGRPLGGKNLELTVGSGDELDVRNFSVHERLSSLFQVNLVAVSENHSIDFDAVVGHPARFRLDGGVHERFWSGLCSHFEQVRVEPSGVSTYQISVVPVLWLLTQRKNYRMFQQISEPDIVLKILKEWDIEPEVRIDKGAYKKRKYRVQYAESDFAFISRMLEDAGITYYFEQAGEETKLVLSDAPQSNPKRGAPLAFSDDTSMVRDVGTDYATSVRMGQRVRPGKVTLRDHDYRRPPSYKLMTSAAGGRGVEEKLERFHYTPGAFLFGTDQGDATPVADDKGKTRTDEKEGAVLAQKRLDAKRGGARVCTFETKAHDLSPGMVMSMAGHPHAALGDGKALLIVESSLSGTARGEWAHHCEARGTEVPFRPELVTPKPTVNGVESATVVGPKGEEIHTDEFGRVRVHFHWDRESKMDQDSSCWIHVSQPWGGTGYGGVNLPRIGQEVLVDFLGGDPDRPIIVGRVYTNLQKVPYTLPANKTQSGWRSNSTGGGGGYNEMMFEDAQGKELVNIQAQKDMQTLVKNDERHTVGRNRTRRVKGNEEVTIGKNRTKRVKLTEIETVGIAKVSTIGVSRISQIGAVDQTTVGAMHLVSVGSKDGGAATTALMVNQKIVFDTGAGATITMDKSSITIKAKTILVHATDGDLDIKGGPMVKINT